MLTSPNVSHFLSLFPFLLLFTISVNARCARVAAAAAPALSLTGAISSFSLIHDTQSYPRLVNNTIYTSAKAMQCIWRPRRRRETPTEHIFFVSVHYFHINGFVWLLVVPKIVIESKDKHYSFCLSTIFFLLSFPIFEFVCVRYRFQRHIKLSLLSAKFHSRIPRNSTPFHLLCGENYETHDGKFISLSFASLSQNDIILCCCLSSRWSWTRHCVAVCIRACSKAKRKYITFKRFRYRLPFVWHRRFFFLFYYYCMRLRRRVFFLFLSWRSTQFNLTSNVISERNKMWHRNVFTQIQQRCIVCAQAHGHIIFRCTSIFVVSAWIICIFGIQFKLSHHTSHTHTQHTILNSFDFVPIRCSMVDSSSRKRRQKNI